MTRRLAVTVLASAAVAGAALVGLPPAASAADCTGTTTPIPAVQGSGDTAAITGTVTVRGVVVGDEEGTSAAGALRGFYLQDARGDRDPATSDGIFVFEPSGADAVSNGQTVQVTGAVTEFQGLTEITSSGLAVCGSGASVRPTDVRFPAASLERYEGMLVRLPQRLTVTEHFQLGRFGQVTVSSPGRLPQPTNVYPAADPRAARLQALNDRSQIVVDDSSQLQNPDPIRFGRNGNPLTAANTLRGGDTLTGATGVLTYIWGGNAASPNAYRLLPVHALGGKAVFRTGNPRPSGVPDVGGTVKVASSNLLNYFVRTSGCTLGVGGAATDCRGADDATELARQRAKEVAALSSLKADVVGLMEIANDGYGPDSSLADLVGALNAAPGSPGTWTYVNPDAALGATDVAGTDAIKVAMIYRSDRVTPKGSPAVDQAYAGWERRPLAQTFTAKAGGTFTTVVNHFKSKGSCPGDGSADDDQGDGQSCWNAHRVQEAGALASFVTDDVVPAAGDPDVLVIGDLNSYAKEDPILALDRAGYVDEIARHERGSYSYAFDGQWGYLDQALAGRTIASQVTGAADVHINADEPSVLDYNTEFKSAGQVQSLYAPDRFRNSDHDPVLIGLRLKR